MVKINNTFHVNVAETQKEKEEIFRLRYDIYIGEMGRPSHADHENKFIKDSLDETAHLLYITQKGKACGTARINFKKESNTEFEEEYRIKEFESYFPNEISETSKFMMEKSWRKSRLPVFFAKELYRHGVENGSKIDFINCNEPLDCLYEKLGYRRYQENFKHPEYGSVVPMVLLTYDVSYLKQVNSPLSKVAQELGISEDKGVDEVKSNFNLYTVHLNKK
ncbi:MAG: N-acyl amino acid synthase FeeM domain-containing protein [Nanoarchaeota archaeon]